MKRNFIFLLTTMLLLMTDLTWGQTRTEVTDVLTREMTGVTGNNYSSWQGVTSNSTAVYAGQSAGGNNSIQLRSSNNNSGIITTSSGGIVTTVSVVWNENTYSGRTLNIYGKNTAYTSPTDLYDAELQGTLLGTIVYGTSTELNISDTYTYIGMRSNNAAMYLSEIDITWSVGGALPVAVPVFSPAGGSYANSVTVTATCATEGATIRYTTNGDDPTEASTVFPAEGITLTETTTVKARAFKADMTQSAVATATYTFPEMYPNIAAWIETHPETNTTVSGISGDLTAVYQNGSYLYVQDATGGLLVYGSMTNTYENGDVISGGIFGISTLYNGLIEFVPTQPLPEGATGTPVEPIVATVAQITSNISDYTSKLVKIEGVTFDEDHTFNTSSSTGRTTTFTQDGNTMTLFDNFKILADFAVTANEEADIVGLIGCHNETVQIFPRSTDDIITGTPTQQTVATPRISPESGQYVNMVEVTITCATEGAVIYYTTDGTDPSETSAVYSEPLKIMDNVTVKAIAMKEGYLNSAVAEASYTIFTPQPVTFSKVMNPIDINTTDSYLLVCESAGTAAIGTIANNALQAVAVNYDPEAHTVSTPVHAAGLPCPIQLEATEGGYYIAINGGYLNNNSGTNLSLGDANSVWALNAYQDGFILQNTSNGDRFIGGTNAEGTAYKAYATQNLGGENYPIVVLYKEGTTTPMQMVEAPTITPDGGIFTDPQEVTLACTTEGATIYYTLDGTDPTTESTVYAAPFTLSENTTVKAMAAAEGMINSPIVSTTFTFTTATTIPITLNIGWTWIPYLKATPMPVEEAFSGITLVDGDIIKGQAGYSTYSAEEGWVGSCKNLEPGKGYMFYSNGTEIRTLIYP